MGVIRFYHHWLRSQFPDDIECIYNGANSIPIEIDNLMIDANGLFHLSAQKIYEYGNYKRPRSLLNPRRKNNRIGGLRQQLRCFQHVCQSIEDLINLTNPRKRVIIAVDGAAPLAKASQQRQRRFRSAKERIQSEEKGENPGFDTCNISVGTKWLDYLTKYIDWYIRKNISTNPRWRDLQIIFSNEKTPGEGEHKLLSYVRLYGDPNESYLLHGMDADLLFLAMLAHVPNFYVLRDDLYTSNVSYHLVDVGNISQELSSELAWASSNSDNRFNPKSAINDFAFMCFLVGNDFLPHIPSVEIIGNGIQVMFDIYRQVCTNHGHLTYNSSSGVKIRLEALSHFFEGIGALEKELFEDKLSHKGQFLPDPLLDSCATVTNEGKHLLDIDKYKDAYYSSNLPEEKDMEKFCHDYIEGLQWVITYYTQGIPNWKWLFGRHYSPFASDLAKYTSSFVMPVYPRTTPSVPFLQLLSILPPKSAYLLPPQLEPLLTSPSSPLVPFCGMDFKVDYAGKKREWEGISLVDFMNQRLVKEEYFKRLKTIDSKDMKRNKIGRSFLYTYNENSYCVFKSYHGDINNCRARVEIIDL